MKKEIQTKRREKKVIIYKERKKYVERDEEIQNTERKRNKKRDNL